MVKELEVLIKKLEKAKIPYTVRENPNINYCQVVVCFHNYRLDAVYWAMEAPFRGSKGSKRGLLEIQGGLTKPELAEDDVVGFLSGKEVAKRFIWCYKHHTPIYKDKYWRNK